MKKILLCSLAVAGVFGASSASALTYTINNFNNYINSSTDAEFVAYVKAQPDSTVNSFLSEFNAALQTPECSDAMLLSDGWVVSTSPSCRSKMANLVSQYLNPQATSSAPTTPTSTASTGTPKTVAETISTAVTPQIQRATSVQQAGIISNVISNIFSSRAPNSPGAPMRMSLGNEKGMAAGNAPTKLNAWVNASDTTIGSSASASLFDGYVTNAIGGVDYRVSDKFVAGLSAGYDRVALNFKFAGLTNSGLVSTGWMVAPYASYQISDLLSVDGAYGYAEGDVDTRTSGVVSTQNYDRNFFALNLNANYWIRDWQLTGKANYIAAEENVATTNKMEQLRLGGQVGYWTKGIMPYASLIYVRDLKVSTGGVTPASLDDDAWVASVGVNLFSKGALSGGISYTEEFDRADSKNYTFTANIGYRF